MKRHFLLLVALTLLCVITGKAQTIVHPEIGESLTTEDGKLTIRLMTRKQNFNTEEAETFDEDINSPKSVNIHPNGKKYYVNSLEGCSTIAYDFATNKKLAAIRHTFDEHKDSALWNAPSGLFPWTHYEPCNTFSGKPVESTFSHNGRYLWIPYYRRTFDINAQDPSAVAVIDTEVDSIVCLMETGPLPKMITTSPDGTIVAISHWGNNTVGLIDISSTNPKEWKYICKLVVDHELELNYPMDVQVDRDHGSGYDLRGTVFTPDNKYLLVGCMNDEGGIAVIDIQKREYLGRVVGMMDNVRHLLLDRGYLYLSINQGGMVQRCSLSKFLEAAQKMENKVAQFSEWQNAKVGRGARTIVISPDGKYIFSSCFYASKLYIVDAMSMKTVGCIDADSHPVGLDISKDGRYVFVTSQSHREKGGNCVDIFEIMK